MEIRGLVVLRVADAQFGKIKLTLENNDYKGCQMQVCFNFIEAPRLGQTFCN